MPNKTARTPLSLKEALAQRLVERRVGTVKVPARYSPNGQELLRSYERYIIVGSTTPEEFGQAAVALAGNLERAMKLFNSQHDIVVKTPIRHRLVAEAKKPTKALEKLAKGLIESRLARDMDEALALVARLRSSEDTNEAH